MKLKRWLTSIQIRLIMPRGENHEAGVKQMLSATESVSFKIQKLIIQYTSRFHIELSSELLWDFLKQHSE